MNGALGRRTQSRHRSASTSTIQVGSNSNVAFRCFSVGRRQAVPLLAVLILLLLPQLGRADEPSSSATKEAKAPKLEPVFSDDFSTDTRGQYEVQGNVSWKEGKLTLAEGASITRDINGGAWAKVELDFGDDGWAPNQDTAELRLVFLLEGTNDCFVRLRKRNQADAATVAVFEIVPPRYLIYSLTNTPKVKLVRQIFLPKAGLNELTVAYRSGVIKITTNQSEQFACYIEEEGAAMVTRASLMAESGRHGLVGLMAVRLPAAATLTEDQRRQVAEAKSAQQQMIALYHQRKFSEAADVGEDALELRKSVLGERHPDYASSLNNLAGIYLSMGNYARAEHLFTQASEIYKSVLSDQHPHYATSLHNLAGLYARMSDYTKAERLYTQSLQIRKSLLGEHHPSYAVNLNNLAGLYQSMGDYARAEQLFTQASEICKSVLGEQHPKYANSLNNLAGLYTRRGDYAGAEPLFTEAAQIQRTNLNRNSLVQSSRQQNQNQSKLRVYLDSYLNNALKLEGPTVRPLENLWQWKGAVTARQSAYRQVASNKRVAPLFKDLQSVSRQLSVLSGRTPIPPPRSAPKTEHSIYQQKRDVWESRFETLNREREDLEQQIAAASEEYRRIQEPLTVAQVQQWLPEDTAFVDFLEYSHSTRDPGSKGKIEWERRYIAFVVHPDREPVMIGLGSAKQIAASITDFRRPFQADGVTGTERKAAADAAQQLRRSLWLPLEDHLAGIDTVIISPDTVLGTLPFAALPGSQPGMYLLEDYRIANIPMTAMLRTPSDTSDERRRPEAGLLVLGDVNYSAGPQLAQSGSTASRPAWMRAAPRSRNAGWISLPGFQDELAIVRDRFESKFGGGVTVLRKGQATEAAFLEQAPRHYNLHVVTHGYFAAPEVKAIGATESPDDERDRLSFARTELAGNDNINEYLPGLLSGLVLAGANNPPSDDRPEFDGILTASEIETLDLNATDLVVLSACETGLGKVAGGEGLTGLQRAFHMAGARSCISSLWKVDDKATQEIMSRFYRYYWHEGQSKINALRNAQLDLLQNPEVVRGAFSGKQGDTDPNKPAPKPIHAGNRLHPHYWAAFQLSGDWQ